MFHSLHCLVRKFPHPNINERKQLIDPRMSFVKLSTQITMPEKICQTLPKEFKKYIRVSVLNILCANSYLTITEHCLDYIRQSLQCSGDLTPMNWAWIERTKKIFFKPGTPHTCRKFDGVWDWVAERKVDWDAEEKHGYNRGPISKHASHQNTRFLQNITKDIY